MRWGRILLVAAVVAAALGGAAGGLGAPAWLAGAIAAVTALVSGVFAGYYFPAQDQRKAAREARDQILDALISPILANTAADPLALLRADQSPMPFRGRGREMRELAEWRDDKEACPVLLLSGSAGVGKSRLALEFASRAPEGWVSGWLHAGTGDTAIGVVAACGEPAVILVDDADGRADVIPLLDSLAERHKNPAIRVVLVTRSADGLRPSLKKLLEERHTWIASGALTLELAPEGGEDDRARWFGEAVRAFATALGKTVPSLPEVFPQGYAGATQPFVMIQARALLAVLGDDGDPRRLSFGEVAEALMRHEERRWEALAKTRDWGSGGPPSEKLRERAVTSLALLGPDSEAEAEEILRRVPELEGSTAERCYDIAAWISTLYPAEAGAAPRIRPDVIGEWFVVSQLTGNLGLAEGLRAGLTDEQAARALGFLARAADWIESAGPLFGEFAAGDIRRYILAAAQAALTGEVGRHLLDAVVATQLMSVDEWTLDELSELDQLIPEYILLGTHAAIADQIVTLQRVKAAADPAARSNLAQALYALGTCLGLLGQYEEALTALEEAVALYRAMPGGTAAHQAALAAALTNLRHQLNQLGRYREALDSAQETVSLLRALTAADADAYQADLAAALSNLSISLEPLGQYDKALAAGQEAVALYRSLPSYTAEQRAVLPRVLGNLGKLLSRLGRHKEALDVTQETVSLFRALAAADPGAYLEDLAAALNNLGLALEPFGRHQEALTVTEESVTLRRALTVADPAVQQAELANALGNLGNILDRVGRYQDALDAMQEAVTLFRGLTAVNPAAHLTNLARTLTNLGDQFDRLGRYQDALDTIEEAVALHRALAADNPAAHQAELAMALGNLGKQLGRVGLSQEALDATEEAVTLFRALVTENPVAHQANLAMALNNLGHYLDLRDRGQEALDAWIEAVRIFREAAARNPELYQAEYQRRLAGLRREYERRGMRLEAIGHDLPGMPPAGETGSSGEDAASVRDK
jgi:tetratricopeptide (TPR) repeat protein